MRQYGIANPENLNVCFMPDNLIVEQRRPIWIALSEFYLDTELDDLDLLRIAKIILKSPFDFEEIKKINKYDVFPLLISNLFSVAGVWGGFNEAWLTEKITARLNRSKLSKMLVDIDYRLSSWMINHYLRRLEKIYYEQKSLNHYNDENR